jgi:hypothetical protein
MSLIWCSAIGRDGSVEDPTPTPPHNEPEPDDPEPDDETQDLVRPLHT